MKSVIIMIVLFVVGVGAAVLYLRSSTSAPSAPNARISDSDPHGAEAAAAKGGPMCAKHHIPESIDAFCHPELVEKLGHCSGHDVAEAFCTRCSPTLIAAFKAEGDWCAEHGLPESQCKQCNADAAPASSS